MRTRCYIAGPISRGDLAHNIKQSEVAFFWLLRAGYAPFNPMWSCYSTGPRLGYGNEVPRGSYYALATQHGGGGCDHADWLGADLPWVAAAHVLLRLPGESRGADMEVAEARKHGIPVYHDIEQLLREIPPQQGAAWEA